MSKLLSDRIKGLHLRPDAPYPSEQLDAKELIRRHRYATRLHLVRLDHDLRRLDPYADLDADTDSEGE